MLKARQCNSYGLAGQTAAGAQLANLQRERSNIANRLGSSVVIVIFFKLHKLV